MNTIQCDKIIDKINYKTLQCSARLFQPYTVNPTKLIQLSQTKAAGCLSLTKLNELFGETKLNELDCIPS